MYRGLRWFIRGSLWACIALAGVSIAYAGSADHENVFSAKDIIMVLFGLLQTVFMGIGVWLIANDKELFTRMGKVETQIKVQTRVCEERWDSGNHPSRRATDNSDEDNS